MGKVKKKSSPEENQKKISSFFKNPVKEKDVQSKLFSSVAPKQADVAAKHSKNGKQTSDSSEVIDLDHDDIVSTNEDTDLVHKESAVLPETQFITPSKQAECLSDLNSPDAVIPDTPEETSKPKGRTIFGRSFLRPVSTMNNSVKKNILPANSRNKVTAKRRQANVVSRIQTGVADVAAHFVGDMRPTVGDSYLNDMGPENSEGNTDVCSVTPTKEYWTGDNVSVKRLSIPGLSPCSKREHGMDVNSDPLSTQKLKSQPRDRVRKVLTLSGISKDSSVVHKRLNSYQLNTNHSKESNEETSADDELLTEILTEMGESRTPSSKKCSKVMKKTSVREYKQTLNEEVSDGKGKIEDEVLSDILNELSSSMSYSETHDVGNMVKVRDKSKNKATTKYSHFSPVGKNAEVEPYNEHTACIVNRKLSADSQSVTDGQSNVQEKSSGFPNINKVSQDIHLDSSPVLEDDFNIEEINTQAEIDDLSELFDSTSPFKTQPCHLQDGILNKTPFSQKWGRYTVSDVKHDRQSYQLQLELGNKTNEKKYCTLEGFWSDSNVLVGDIVHVLGEFDDHGVCHITDTAGLIIINPDLLLSGTSIVSSVFCMRRSVLNEKFKGCDSKNIQMLYGSIIHCVFQQVLKTKSFEDNKIQKHVEEILKHSKFLHEMYGNNVDQETVREEIQRYLPQLKAWIEQYTSFGKSVLCAKKSSSEDITITSIQDIEENIWSPRFGVKGKIDMTVEVQIRRPKIVNQKKVVPLELKTGRPTYSIEHKGQVTLYSMMSSDRREDPKEGLLLYLKEPSMKCLPAVHESKRGLMQLRNEMAYYISRQVQKAVDGDDVTYQLGQLPQPINSQRSCSKCPHLQNCSLYQSAVERREFPTDHAMSTLVPETLSHLTKQHLDYFVHWCLMLDLETQCGKYGKQLRDLWCCTSTEREEKGECLGGLVVNSCRSISQLESKFDDQYLVSFKKHPQLARNRTSLKSVGLLSSDMVTVSTEEGDFLAMCSGLIQNITDTAIEILTERELSPRDPLWKTRTFRIDKCDNFSTASMLYTNLSRLLSNDAHCSRLRSIIVDRKEPEFKKTMSKESFYKVKHIIKSLNKPQRTAVMKCLLCEDFVMIKGYPGTGKTSVIVTLVKILYILGYSVLLTSYTHSAVDNILLKLKKDNLDIIRLGRLSRIHPLIHCCAAEKQTASMSTVKELREYYSSQRIIATTCLGMNYPVFTQRKFDFCIVDEASQVLQPACLGPLLTASRFILVGDPKQLPPIVQSKEARKLGLDESLFARLDSNTSTFELVLQYRMNQEIMAISNTLIYDGALSCGNESVANCCLSISEEDVITKRLSDKAWLMTAVGTSLSQSVIFFDTHEVPAPEIRNQNKQVANTVEADIIVTLVQTYTSVGIAQLDIGIITPYRNQVKLIRERLASCGQGDVEVNTVDQYQGRDKSVVLISFVRSSNSESENQTGELLKDLRRLNVAVTRSKHKLVMVGDIPTLQLYQPLETIIYLLRSKEQIFKLPTRNKL